MGRSIFKKAFDKIKGKKRSSSNSSSSSTGYSEIEEADQMCYNFKPDGSFIIGTRREFTEKYHLAPKELEDSTYRKLEASIQAIDSDYIKSISAEVAVQSTDKIVFKNGAEISLDAKFDAQVKAMVDLSKLMIELGADVSAGIKAEFKSKTLNLGSVSLQGFLTSELTASASAKLSINPTQVLAEAKAVAEAKLTIGAALRTPTFAGGKYSVEIKPTISAYAKVEASALAAAGLSKTGVKVEASAAVGIRAAIEASVMGEAHITDTFDNRTVIINDGALGSLKIEVDVSLMAGGELEFTYEIKDDKDKDTGLTYKSGNVAVKGGLVVGIGGTVEAKVLDYIWDEVKEKIKAKFKDVIYKLISDKVLHKFEELKAKAEQIKETISNSATKFGIALVDLIGMHVTATEMEMERQNLKIVNAFGELMADNNEDNVAHLTSRYEKYHEFLIAAFDQYTVELPKIAQKTSQKIQEIRDGGSSREESDAIAEMKGKVEKILVTLRKLHATEQKLGELAGVDPEYTQLPVELVNGINAKANFMDSFIGYAERILSELSA